MTLIKWTQQASIRKAYPELKLLFHIPNERHCDPREGKRLKLMGVKSGVPDLFLPVARGKNKGLFIELKAENGKPSDNQMWWFAELGKQNYLAAICYGWKQAADMLMHYLGGDDNAGQS
ncbi:VRR-NUC domain-containing protein [Ruminococcus sp. AM31-15AC]|nr:VRR-NUC domain-containing protein [Ruminococcus sp. AM31-15AC]